MTITYTNKVASATFGGFIKLLFRWRGSVYSLIWKELTIYLFVYYALSLSYRFLMNESSKRSFELVVIYCKSYQDALNVSFVLGYFISVAMTRWHSQYFRIPWPDSFALLIIAYCRGDDDRAHLMRRTIVRYVNLSYVIAMRSLAPPVMERFPTFEHMVTAGMLLPGERNILEQIHTPFNKYHIPIVWAMMVLNRARKERVIENEFGVMHITSSIVEFRDGLDWITFCQNIYIPIVYTQVVTFCTYMYFIFNVMSDQFIDRGGHLANIPKTDFYFPLAAVLKFLFYMGWLKVAEVIVNPFGDDDDDFEINSYIDRNWTYSYLLVDETHAKNPELKRDLHWDHVTFQLPYTAANSARTSEQRNFDKDSDLFRRYSERITRYALQQSDLKRASSIARSRSKQKSSQMKTPFDNRFEEMPLKRKSSLSRRASLAAEKALSEKRAGLDG